MPPSIIAHTVVLSSGTKNVFGETEIHQILYIICVAKVAESGAAPGVFLGMQVNTHDLYKTVLIIAKH